MMEPRYEQQRGYAHIYDTLNALAGENRESIKSWLKMINEDVDDSFLDQLAQVIIACPWEISKAICDMYWRLSIGGINPKESPLFRKRILVDAIPSVVANLQERASDLSLRSSFAKHKKTEIEDMDGGL